MVIKFNDKKIIALIAVILAALMTLLFFWRAPSSQNSPNNEDAICTMEALVCPDGSEVGRAGPNCEFSPCPGLGGIPALKP
jgi:hypothetical protein